eukprot:GHUV01053913.1.p1 GENE.GHUV01053913.1~~GHUV01053913.1.p1  ORF type:complete len:195 (+),score=64.31 GHUV01053913.1:88-672(+)
MGWCSFLQSPVLVLDCYSSSGYQSVASTAGPQEGCSEPCCRQVTADMLQQQHAHEVLKEQSRRQHWESAFAAWRTLRSKHAVQHFCQQVKREWFEPSAQLDLFTQLRASQEGAHTKLVQQCRKVGELVPPRLTSEAVQAWLSETRQWSQEWHQQMAAHLQLLQQQEDQLEQQVGMCVRLMFGVGCISTVWHCLL